MTTNDSVEKLFTLVSSSKSIYHCFNEAKRQLEEAGFCEWDMQSGSIPEKGKGYYVSMFGRSLAAFKIPLNPIKSFRIATSHTDSPCFVIKPHPERSKSGCITLNVEKYGGPIVNTWLDRPLTIAGRVCISTDDPFRPQTVLYTGKNALVIPNLAIHMNREVNKGIELSVQNDCEPIAGIINKDTQVSDYLLSYIAKDLGTDISSILDCELYLYNGEEPCTAGFKDEFLSAPRLDNLTSCQSCLNAVISCSPLDNICCVSVLFDNEECGSRTKQGAGSVMLASVLEKLYISQHSDKNSRAGFLSCISDSMIVSLDVAHATHPNHPEKNDPTNLIPLDAGVVIKMNYNQRYATDSVAVSIVEGICRKNNIPYKKFVNQGDTAGGGTLGNIISSSIPALAADIGVPILAMHSSREFMAASSQNAMDHFVEAFFR